MQVTFAVDSSEITGNFDTEIANVAKFFRENPLMTTVIEGHTDSTGTPQHNPRLSGHRADSVHKMLLEEHDINPEQLNSIGYGLTRPIGDNDTAQGRSLNRRGDLVLDASEAATGP
jgi:outer membrane protein OmpA-like peptidoglycan-associated protein